ncbi:MAG: class II fructose-bisphosphate aldolase [Deltaproteobacteria bacterium]|nr:class II fructose-bisphosphate aldolase [Deltaproteobacteria bacterium]
MPQTLWTSIAELENAVKGICSVKHGELTVADKSEFAKFADELAWNAVFNPDEKVRGLARWYIWEGSAALKCPSASIHDLYMERAHNEYESATVPAINIRGLTYDVARTIFRSMKKNNACAIIFEIAKSEIDYTKQRPAEYASVVLAAAIRESYVGPVFIQGDHFQVNAKKYAANAREEMESLKKLMTEAIEAGFYNIDIDSSTIVDLSKPTCLDQQRANFETCAELTKHIRKFEPKGMTISVGGEIGEVGGKNSTVEELATFMEGYNSSLGTAKNRITGISKISVQTGTSHGGVPLPDGKIAKVKLDFEVLEQLGAVAREQFHLGGVVQHGASTLPEEAFDNFPKKQTVEVHLATGFQNIIYDSAAFPKEVKDEIYAWLKQNCAGERKEGDSEEQFYYKTRKKGFGPFKQKLWSLPEETRSAIMSELSRTVDMLFKKLNAVGSKKLTDKYIKPVAVHKRPPVI